LANLWIPFPTRPLICLFRFVGGRVLVLDTVFPPIAFLLHPRCGCRAIAKAVAEGSDFREVGDLHGGPEEMAMLAGYRILTNVRNPFDLLVSERILSTPFYGPGSIDIDWLEGWLVKQTNHFPAIGEGHLFRFLGEMPEAVLLVRFEGLEASVRSALGRFGIFLLSEHFERIGETPGRDRDWRPYYDATSRAWVEHYFRDELQLLGYEFGDGRTAV